MRGPHPKQTLKRRTGVACSRVCDDGPSFGGLWAQAGLVLDAGLVVTYSVVRTLRIRSTALCLACLRSSP